MSRYQNIAECGLRIADWPDGLPVNPQSPIPDQTAAPWHFLNFFPLPQGQGSLRPTPANGFAAGPAGAPGAVPTAAGAALPRPSAAALVATIGAGRRPGSPAGPVAPRAPRPAWPRPAAGAPAAGGAGGGGPTSICNFSQRSVNVAWRSRIRPTNIS